MGVIDVIGLGAQGVDDRSERAGRSDIAITAIPINRVNRNSGDAATKSRGTHARNAQAHRGTVFFPKGRIGHLLRSVAELEIIAILTIAGDITEIGRAS